MERETVDILISGGGVAGLTAAAAFGTAGYSVLCVDPAPPVTSEQDEGADLRTTAFLQPSVPVLTAAGLWERLEPFATPLQIMRIVDAGGDTPEPRVIKDFDAADISDQPFGWNLPNWLLRREMVARLEQIETAQFRPGTGTRSVLTRDNEVLVTLSDGAQVSARLLIGADGRNSAVREALGIGARTIRYGQKALAFAVTHPIPHANVSTEIHRSGGPFTLVPLPDRDGYPCSAVVWMERGPEAQRLAALPEAEFEAAMSERSCHLFGPLKLASRRSVWPIISQIAQRMTGARTALMAEAAHVVPPIGAQGLNMSLADLRVLLELVEGHPGDIGAASVLESYHRRRHPEVLARVTGIDALNRASMLGGQGLRDLRAGALNALYSLAPVRKTLMRAGLGMR
ncbi:2-octaprenyl-6-methoxyphenyl hydroxylase [Defluviimonas sp. 20V17]|uniref:2-octaprenyl-6-methoxyphenol hydroxylase n=1 Tax=Allgaiera indica TaxID=765699 RepID=A0AAN5A021_9RHOB|nr:UbiH/UbiF family hydroxylase [Allgaiera indica]KDB02082.1 2-octaprenyl-6-methoxyphenyl hydroxylase [Defluviimonas sp. 20V17]GHE03168.1 2-octaprenyl-6-methoxyphenyl hydroxylase [Allgaiera indica]SDX10246.1 2-octaprenyl-6-methoxyphenol hydroxylase [Allgaiera indica]